MEDKSYYDYIDEVSSDDLFEGMLSEGMFSEKLPPVFSSASFYNFYMQNADSFSFKDRPYDYVHFDSLKSTNMPRHFGVPHPFAYLDLCLELRKNWERIKQHFRAVTLSQSFKISRMHLKKQSHSHSLFELDYKKPNEEVQTGIEMALGKKYKVKTDIAICFPSLYSHSIAWALLGKEEAKEIKDDKENWANVIDQKSRNLHNSETHGLMVGPYTSHLISEIILTRVDFEINNIQNRKYLRNIDDYLYFADDLDDAEKFVKDLGNVLNKYALNINHNKTKIEPLPASLQDSWVSKISMMPFADSNKVLELSDVRMCFDYAVDLYNQYKDSAILNFAIRIISSKLFDAGALIYFYNSVFYLTCINPYLIRMLKEHVFEKFRTNVSAIKEFSNIAYSIFLKNKNYEGIYYLVYFSLVYDFTIDSACISDFINTDDCLMKLFGYLYYEKYGDECNIEEFKKDAKALKSTNFDRYWIFIYEVLDSEDLEDTWSQLKKAKISFLIKIYHK